MEFIMMMCLSAVHATRLYNFSVDVLHFVFAGGTKICCSKIIVSVQPVIITTHETYIENRSLIKSSKTAKYPKQFIQNITYVDVIEICNSL
jgi:hypothetical protein